MGSGRLPRDGGYVPENRRLPLIASEKSMQKMKNKIRCHIFRFTYLLNRHSLLQGGNGSFADALGNSAFVFTP
ncbi:hypothetical protein EES43_28885 [Streptomyces sp. ADI96-02]|nr:hypothetical protein EES43_28885 [Streptomyces sp. ADI96-02]